MHSEIKVLECNCEGEIAAMHLKTISANGDLKLLQCIWKLVSKCIAEISLGMSKLPIAGNAAKMRHSSKLCWLQEQGLGTRKCS